MSRVLLALKVSVEEGAALADKGKRKVLLPRTLVFDEIDIGIGGRAAEAVGLATAFSLPHRVRLEPPAIWVGGRRSHNAGP